MMHGILSKRVAVYVLQHLVMSHAVSEEEWLSFSHLSITSQKWAGFKEPQIARMICVQWHVLLRKLKWNDCPGNETGADVHMALFQSFCADARIFHENLSNFVYSMIVVRYYIIDTTIAITITITAIAITMTIAYTITMAMAIVMVITTIPNNNNFGERSEYQWQCPYIY